MRAADTNLLVRLFVADSPAQTAAAEAFVAAGAWISTVTLAEAIWVLKTIYGRTPTHLALVITSILDHRTLVVQESDAVAAALDLFRTHPRLGFTDCLILELARAAAHLPLGTFDPALARQPDAQKLP